jgi:hypothetical protein
MANSARKVNRNPEKRAVELIESYRALHRTAQKKGDLTACLRALDGIAEAEKNLHLMQHRTADEGEAAAGVKFMGGLPCCGRCGARLPREVEVRFNVVYEDVGSRRTEIPELPARAAAFDWVAFSPELDRALDASATKTFELIYQKAHSRGLLKGAGEDEIDVDVEATVPGRGEGEGKKHPSRRRKPRSARLCCRKRHP